MISVDVCEKKNMLSSVLLPRSNVGMTKEKHFLLYDKKEKC